MATDIQPTASDKASHPGFQHYRLNSDQYLRMIESGIFPDHAHVELLGGLLIEQMTKYAPHDFTVGRLGRLLNRTLPADWIVREEKSIALGRFWRPEPDLAIVRGPDDRYRSVFPGPVDVAALIEVSESSYAIDRGVKWRGYASARINAYWIVHLAKAQIEVYSDPVGKGRSASYRTSTIFAVESELPHTIDGLEVGRLAVRDVLPGV